MGWVRGNKTDDKRDDVWCGMGVVGGMWVGVDRIVGEVVLYAHEVWNRGVKRLCGGGGCAGDV